MGCRHLALVPLQGCVCFSLGPVGFLASRPRDADEEGLKVLTSKSIKEYAKALAALRFKTMKLLALLLIIT